MQIKTIANHFKKTVFQLCRLTIKENRIAARRVTFRLMYERFREILVLNDTTLELIADIEELLANRRLFSFDTLSRRIRNAAMDVFLMVKDINLIAEGRYTALYGALERLNNLLEAEIAPARKVSPGKLVVSLNDLRAADAPLVGSKMANLGEIAAYCGCAVPEGFAITTEAFLRFMADADLWEKCEHLDALLELEDAHKFIEACHEAQAAIRAMPVADDIANAILHAFAEHFPEEGILVAVRSSATGEDTAVSSHAGLYHTELNVNSTSLISAYKAVLASAFSPTAVSYRFQRGITTRESLMAVGCVRMIQPRCAGIAVSRLPDDPQAEAMIISATRGMSTGITAGNENAETWVVPYGQTSNAGGSLLSANELTTLIEATRKLESHFGTPQDIEWAIDSNGTLRFLQARPMNMVLTEARPPEHGITDRAPLIEGGYTACPGIGSGSVVILSADDDLASFPDGGILVARHSSPNYAQIMTRCVAIITDVGSPTGHMSSLAREFQIPAIVGLDGATRSLHSGQCVTVDAWHCRVFDGLIPSPVPSPRLHRPTDAPALERLRKLAQLVTPLTMTDPASADFHPDNCRSLHDITRYVHEKVFDAMFHYGDIASVDEDHSLRLEAKLPIRVEVFDVGGGIAPGDRITRSIRQEDILSIPMLAFLKGLLEPQIRWDLPRPVSLRGFLSVLGESMAGPPAQTSEIGRVSYAIISDHYLNFSTKAGYHFSTVDSYCGRSINKNYIHFRFSGGAAVAERRERRIRFLSKVVSALDFKVQIRGDLLIARLDKYSEEDIRARLLSLGRLTLCSRQLDMLMDNKSSPDLFAQAFLEEDWHKF